jgi:hypothetical protein
MFTKAIYACLDREPHFLGRLTKLHQIGSITYFITTFEKLDIRTEGLSNVFYVDFFISGLKEAIWAHVNMHHPTTWLQACQLGTKVDSILQAPPMKAPVLNHPHPRAHPAPTQTLKVQKISPTEMVEHHKQGLCYYCDEKYSPWHKCREQKFFHIDASASSPYEDTPS